MDVHTKNQRSKNMTAIKSRGNKTTEQKLLGVLRESKIRGWRRHYKKLPGTPDFVFPKKKLAVFTDGCFWHGCRKHCVMPKSNKKFWKEKISKNKARDKRVNTFIKKQGWRVVRIWEHEIEKANNMIVNKIVKFLGVNFSGKLNYKKQPKNS